MTETQIKTIDDVRDQLCGLRGVEVPSQNSAIVYHRNGSALYIYNTLIAIKLSGKVYLSDKWDYSITTGKHRNAYLGETKKQTEAKIASGEYTVLERC